MTYKEALAEARKVGVSKCSDPALMAQFLDANAQILIGAVSPELMWDGAQKTGLTTKALVALINKDPMAAANLMFESATPSGNDVDCPDCHDAGCIDCTDPGIPIPDAILADIRTNHTTWTTQQLGQEEIKRMFHIVRLLLADNDRLRAAAEPLQCETCGEPVDADGHIEHRPGTPCTTDYRPI